MNGMGFVSILTIVLAVAVTAATLAAQNIGIMRAWGRQWRAAVIFGGFTMLGGLVNLIGVPVLATRLVVWSWRHTPSAAPEDRARMLAETVAKAMTWGSWGIVGIPFGLVLVIVGAVGWWRSSRRRARVLARWS